MANTEIFLHEVRSSAAGGSPQSQERGYVFTSSTHSKILVKLSGVMCQCSTFPCASTLSPPTPPLPSPNRAVGTQHITSKFCNIMYAARITLTVLDKSALAESPVLDTSILRKTPPDRAGSPSYLRGGVQLTHKDFNNIHDEIIHVHVTCETSLSSETSRMRIPRSTTPRLISS